MATLTTAQMQALKAHIVADPTLGPISSGPSTDYQAIANALNADASPTTLAWMTAVAPQVLDEAPNYNQFDAISAGKRDSWFAFLAFPRDLTRQKVRGWITDVWGNATAGSNSESILLAGTEKASRAEVVIGGTTRTTGTVSALDRGWTGELSAFDIGAVMSA